MTHEFMAEMLGVRRPTVSLTLAALRHAGLVDAGRGHVTILNRHGLEAVSCECWRVSTDEYRRLVGGPGPGLERSVPDRGRS
jgi:Mn-dependent DtxR family transcriptional regulator